MKLIELRKLCLPGTIRNPYTKRCNRTCKNGNERITNSKQKTFRCYKRVLVKNTAIKKQIVVRKPLKKCLNILGFQKWKKRTKNILKIKSQI